jgi:hypothetical protein
MRSDVPFGAYLSGGLDSSSVVALLARQGAGKIKTFTLVYEGDFPNKENDRNFARVVAERCGTEHHEHLVTFDDLPEKLNDIVRAFDEPFSGVISTYFITESIARHVKVALSGDGSDELFASYLPHRIAAPLAAYGEGRNDPDSLVPFENDIARLALLHDRGDEAARRMGLYLLDDKEKYPLLVSHAGCGQWDYYRGLDPEPARCLPQQRSDQSCIVPRPGDPVAGSSSALRRSPFHGAFGGGAPAVSGSPARGIRLQSAGSFQDQGRKSKKHPERRDARSFAPRSRRPSERRLHHADQRMADRASEGLRKRDTRAGKAQASGLISGRGCPRHSRRPFRRPPSLRQSDLESADAAIMVGSLCLTLNRAPSFDHCAMKRLCDACFIGRVLTRN